MHKKVCVKCAYSLHWVHILKWKHTFIRLFLQSCSGRSKAAKALNLWQTSRPYLPPHGPKVSAPWMHSNAHHIAAKTRAEQNKPVLPDLAVLHWAQRGFVGAKATADLQIRFRKEWVILWRMIHPVRWLCPPPDIALKSICQTTLGLPASWPVETQGGNEHGSVPLIPCRSCKNQNKVRKFATDDNRKVFQMHT